MTGTASLIGAVQDHARKIVELTKQLDAKVKRRNAVAGDQSTALRTIEKLKAQIQADGVAAILADVPFEPAADLARQLRKADAKLAPCAAALIQLDSEISGLRSELEAERRARITATFSYSAELQRCGAENLKARLLALLLSFAALAAIDVIRARHAAGAMSGLPAGGDRPWQSTQVILNFLKGLPVQPRPIGFSLENIQREALKHVETIEADLLKEQNNA